MAKHLPPPKNKHVKPTMTKVAEAADAAERMIQRRKMPETAFSMTAVLPVLAALAIFVLALLLKAEGLKGLASFVLPAVVAGAAVLWRTVQSALRREFSEGDILILVAVTGAFLLREYAAGAAAMILYRFAELLEAFLAAHSRAAMDKLRQGLPKNASIETEDGVNVVPVGKIAVGQTIIVLPGETIPADGVITDGMTSLDTILLTGKAPFKTVAVGSEVMSGCVNQTQMIKIKVTHTAEESAAEKLMELAEISHTNRSSREKFMARFAVVFTPVAAIAGVLIGVIPPLFNHQWLEWLRRSVLFLLLASPCGLTVSVPVTYFGTIVQAARKGVFVKGTKFIETLSRAQTLVFEKTGVITERIYTIAEVYPENGNEEELLRLATMAEGKSSNPIAKALRAECGEPEEESMQVEEIPCRGISVFAGGKHICVGNAGLMMEHGIHCAVPRRKGIAIHVAADNQYMGYFLMTNKTRDGAFDALESMRHRGVRNMVMLTGDLHSVARQIASSLSFDMVKTELDPNGKLTAVEYLSAAKADRATLIFVGDGRNDAKLFERADAGVVLGAIEEPKAMEEADVIVMGEDIQTLAELMRMARQTDLSARLSIIVTLTIRLTGLLLGLFGLVPLMAAVLVEAAATVYSAVNALRAMRGFRFKPEE